MFPIKLFPDPVARFVHETSAAIGCDESMVALPVLSALGSAIGTTRAITLKPGWLEPPVIWACVIARSGTMKSPAHDAALQPLRDMQDRRFCEYEAARADYNSAIESYENEASARRRGPVARPAPKKPEAPVCIRHLVSDATVEALAPILANNPRGVLLARDELAGWIKGFNQYKSRGGADAQHWLELWRAGTLTVDRKTGDARTIHVRRAAVSVCGTIQPGVFAASMTGEHFESGLAARLLIAHPPEAIKRWSTRSASSAVRAGYANTAAALLALEHVAGEHGPDPVKLTLTPDALLGWGEWYDAHARRIAEAGADREAAALAKLEAYAARFALVFTLIENANAREVGADAIRRGCALADWFAGEAMRVYGLLGEDEESRELRQLTEWITRKGGAVTPRDLTRNLRAYPTANEAEAALEGMVKAGLGTWEHAGHGGGVGRPTRRFILTGGRADETPPETPADGAGADEIPENPKENRNCVGVGSVGAPESARSVGAWGEV
ncbi:MAG: DUF3987 domain-containing protein [Phycisphaerae bacterium]|nr:DUF3987 domain-containing protein [Phycisphaerae bacterium]NUQ07967.1 DUF3987 domain-containing protein [Phycisphaerae bacterium]